VENRRRGERRWRYDICQAGVAGIAFLLIGIVLRGSVVALVAYSCYRQRGSWVLDFVSTLERGSGMMVEVIQNSWTDILPAMLRHSAACRLHQALQPSFVHSPAGIQTSTLDGASDGHRLRICAGKLPSAFSASPWGYPARILAGGSALPSHGRGTSAISQVSSQVHCMHVP
jgi:hypothetical protein